MLRKKAAVECTIIIIAVYLEFSQQIQDLCDKLTVIVFEIKKGSVYSNLLTAWPLSYAVLMTLSESSLLACYGPIAKVLRKRQKGAICVIIYITLTIISITTSSVLVVVNTIISNEEKVSGFFGGNYSDSEINWSSFRHG